MSDGVAASPARSSISTESAYETSQSQTSAGQTSVEGCLQGSDGNFTLADSSGTTYQLNGDTSKLSKHVGNEVQITGSTSGSTSGSSAASSSKWNVPGSFPADVHRGEGETYIRKLREHEQMTSRKAPVEEARDGLNQAVSTGLCSAQNRSCHDFFVEAVFSYEPPVGERELTALNGVREVYGVWLVKFNQDANSVTVQYDLSRLTESDIEFMLRNAGIRLQTPLAKVA
jgi:hypothetical protein